MLQRERGLAPATVNSALAQLSGFFTWAIRRKLVSAHVIRFMVERPRLDNARERWLRPDEVAAVINHCPGWLKPIVEFAVKSGWRLSDVCEAEVRCHEVDAHGRAFLRTANRTKNGTYHYLPLEGGLRKLVEAQMVGRRAGEILFPGPHGRSAKAAIRRHFPTAVRRAGLKYGRTKDGVTFHSLRHTMASLALNNGIPEAVVQQMGVWRDRQMVARYAHIADETLRAAAAKLDTVV